MRRYLCGGCSCFGPCVCVCVCVLTLGDDCGENRKANNHSVGVCEERNNVCVCVCVCVNQQIYGSVEGMHHVSAPQQSCVSGFLGLVVILGFTKLIMSHVRWDKKIPISLNLQTDFSLDLMVDDSSGDD